MVIPAAEISSHWNVALQNQERDVGEELDKAIDPFDEAPDVCVSEEEDAAALKESKEQAAHDIRKDNNGTLAQQAMRCAQSLEDTEGLEEEVMFNDHLSCGGKSSAFSGYKGSSEHRGNGFHLRQAGFLMGTLGTVEDHERSASCSPKDVSSHCGRGCCALPWNSFTVRGTLIGPEYLEEDQFPAKSSRPSGISDKCFSRSSGTSVSTSAVQSMLLSVLKQKSSLSSDCTSLSGVLQEIIAREIGEHTTQAIQALQKQA